MPFSKGQSGNPAGRPAGSRNRFTREMDAALEKRGLPLVDAIADHAHAANPTAMRLCFERLAGRRRPSAFQLPPVETPDYTVAALTEVQRALGAGEITSEEATRLVDLVGRIVRVLASTAAAELEVAERLGGSEALGLLFREGKRAAGGPDAIPIEEAVKAPEVKSEGVIVNNNTKTMSAAGVKATARSAPALPAQCPPSVRENEDPRVADALDKAVQANLPHLYSPRRASAKEQLMNSASPSALLVGEITEKVLAGKTASVLPPLAPAARAA